MLLMHNATRLHIIYNSHKSCTNWLMSVQFPSLGQPRLRDSFGAVLALTIIQLLALFVQMCGDVCTIWTPCLLFAQRRRLRFQRLSLIARAKKMIWNFIRHWRSPDTLKCGTVITEHVQIWKNDYYLLCWCKINIFFAQFWNLL